MSTFKLTHIIFIFILIMLFHVSKMFITPRSNSSPPKKSVKVLPGIDVLIKEKMNLIKDKRVGLITNATGITSSLQSTIDVLHRHPSANLVALFSPEHGIRGDLPGGEYVKKYEDDRTGLIVHSLYGRTRKPTPEMLKGIDVLMYDIQDIGSRAYTYIYTMAYAMEAAHEQNLPFIFLDRPNPLGGLRVEGNILDPKFSSFVGLYPIPQVYGMTIGELARLFNTEFGIGCDLTVVPMKGWRREMLFEDTGLMWVPTSPHVPHAETAFFVVATGFMGELDTMSEGVGYTSPFELVGAPWMDGEELAQELNSRKLAGVYFRPTHFKPNYAKFIGTQLEGVQIHLLDKRAFSPAATQIHILTAIQKLYPEHEIFNTDRSRVFDKVYGTDRVRQRIIAGESAETIIRSWEDELNRFKRIRQKYLIYR